MSNEKKQLNIELLLKSKYILKSESNENFREYFYSIIFSKNVKDIRKLFRNMAECIEHIHSKNIIHKNLKLDSFGIDQNGQICLKYLKKKEDDKYRISIEKDDNIFDLGICFIEILTGRNILSEALQKVEVQRNTNYYYYLLYDQIDDIYDEIKKLIPEYCLNILERMCFDDTTPTASEVVSYFEDDYVKTIKCGYEDEMNNEIKMLKYLQSDYVVKMKKFSSKRGIYLERYDTDGSYFFGNFSTKEYSLIFRRMSKCIQYIHSKGVIHGDINPRIFRVNINSFKIVLSDFEIATFKSGKYKSKITSFYYDSPELQYGNYSSKKGDIYSLGLTFLSFLIGKPVLSDYVSNHSWQPQTDFNKFVQQLKFILQKADKKYPNISFILSQMLQLQDFNRCSISDVVHFF